MFTYSPDTQGTLLLKQAPPQVEKVDFPYYFFLLTKKYNPIKNRLVTMEAKKKVSAKPHWFIA
ncbi:hypothetical protein A3A79_05080 [Candidatus Gottesmanbacteria bacterium RIFCSPLOWO2_01_FULL_43_11b]|uniref:Uncharacterized protein n=1 Tax=Candidatus Gottesmanbacteria bacterium RIFCSPLOWO2_01_FULL_43_11b TaxID=1798392 RepID=A0A1F6AIL1_9BACT|nr:MAG: hypothetical protein A3A79_05080 [Candidatus Gottesmanbacteria bacterium RIFCSPLOWO2_01_FULL_43_11b]